MPVRTTRRGIASVHLLVGLAAEHGVPTATCLRGSDIPTRLLREPGAEIEARQELAVERNIVRHLGRQPDHAFKRWKGTPPAVYRGRA